MSHGELDGVAVYLHKLTVHPNSAARSTCATKIVWTLFGH